MKKKKGKGYQFGGRVGGVTPVNTPVMTTGPGSLGGRGLTPTTPRGTTGNRMFKKGGRIDGIAQRGRTRGKIC